MTRQLIVKFARASMCDVMQRASAAPVEPDIANSSAQNVEAIDAGEWDDDIEALIHLSGFFDCQLNWWRIMSDKERRNVAFYRAVRAAHKYPKRRTGRTYTAAIDSVLSDGKAWGFTTRGAAVDQALAFGAAYEGDGSEFLKEPSRIGAFAVKPRGRNGGRRKKAA